MWCRTLWSGLHVVENPVDWVICDGEPVTCGVEPCSLGYMWWRTLWTGLYVMENPVLCDGEPCGLGCMWWRTLWSGLYVMVWVICGERTVWTGLHVMREPCGIRLQLCPSVRVWQPQVWLSIELYQEGTNPQSSADQSPCFLWSINRHAFCGQSITMTVAANQLPWMSRPINYHDCCGKSSSCLLFPSRVDWKWKKRVVVLAQHNPVLLIHILCSHYFRCV
jgi:hypothetical protein